MPIIFKSDVRKLILELEELYKNIQLKDRKDGEIKTSIPINSIINKLDNLNFELNPFYDLDDHNMIIFKEK
jgi:hypothetical protein